MKFKKINNDIIKNRKRLNLVICFCIGLIFIIYGIIINNADYSIDLKFNNQKIPFFEKETLYFSSDVIVSGKYDGFKLLLNGSKVKGKEVTLKQGNNTLVFKKHFRKYKVEVDIDYSPSIYFEDEDGNIIHNYLSNTKPFVIKIDNLNSEVLINDITYDGEVVKEYDNYSIIADGKNYNINILNKK